MDMQALLPYLYCSVPPEQFVGANRRFREIQQGKQWAGQVVKDMPWKNNVLCVVLMIPEHQG